MYATVAQFNAERTRRLTLANAALLRAMMDLELAAKMYRDGGAKHTAKQVLTMLEAFR